MPAHVKLAGRSGAEDKLSGLVPLTSPMAGCIDVLSPSACVSQTRPFYTDHADVYDLLVTDPVEPWVEAVHDRLLLNGWFPAMVLDAGCGTGRHAAALTARGHHVDLADASEQLLAQAASRNPASLALHVDLCTLSVGTMYHAVMCRGVLNDMTTDAERDNVLHAFAAALAEGGILMLDVRESEASRRRADGVPRHRTVDLRADGALEYTSTVTWESGLLHVVEHFERRVSNAPAGRRVFDFVMRPWSAQELCDCLATAGFELVEVGPGVGRMTGDRLFVVARKLLPPVRWCAIREADVGIKFSGPLFLTVRGPARWREASALV